MARSLLSPSSQPSLSELVALFCPTEKTLLFRFLLAYLFLSFSCHLRHLETTKTMQKPQQIMLIATITHWITAPTVSAVFSAAASSALIFSCSFTSAMNHSLCSEQVAVVPLTQQNSRPTSAMNSPSCPAAHVPSIYVGALSKLNFLLVEKRVAAAWLYRANSRVQATKIRSLSLPRPLIF